MDRAPGLSVRLKLTLSYAGFLMLAGAVMLAAVWVFLLRYLPDDLTISIIPSGSLPNRSDPLHGSTAVEKLQAALGVTQTGAVTLGDAVFEPTALRVTILSAQLGGATQTGQMVLQATSTTRIVQVALGASQQTEWERECGRHAAAIKPPRHPRRRRQGGPLPS